MVIGHRLYSPGMEAPWTVTYRRGRRRIFVSAITADVWLWLLIDIESGGSRIASGQAVSEAEALARAADAERRSRDVRG